MKTKAPLALGSLLILIISNLQAAGSDWSTPTAVSPTGNPDPTRGAQTDTVAVNSSGLAVAAWDQYFYTNGGGSTIGVNVQTNGRWGMPITLSDPTKYCDRANAAVGGDDTAVLAWACQDPTSSARTIEASVRHAGSTQWAAPIVLASGFTRVSPDPSNVRVAMNTAGEAWVAWSIFDGAHYVVQAAYRPAGADTSFRTPMTVSVGGEDAIEPSLALNDNGETAIAWAGSPWNMSTSPNTITVVKSPAGGAAFGAPTQVAPLQSPYTGYQNSPAVCLDGNNRAMVMWMGAGLQANWENSPGSWNWPQPEPQPPVIILASNNISSYITPSLACDDQGNAIASVVIFDATVGVQRAQLWAATFGAAAGIWSAQAKLTGLNPRKTEDIAAASATLSPDGGVAYIAYIDHYNGVVKAIHLGTSGWGTPYTLGKTSNVSSFAEVVNGAAAAGSQARVLWKTQAGAVHMATDWRP